MDPEIVWISSEEFESALQSMMSNVALRSPTPINLAEDYLMILDWLEIDKVENRLGPAWYEEFAEVILDSIRFGRLPLQVRFRALVEDWNLEQMKKVFQEYRERKG